MTVENPQKTSRKQAWCFLAISIVGLGLLRLNSTDHGYLEDARHYQPPALTDLRVTEGNLRITDRHKGLGGDIIVTQADGSQAKFSCVVPGVKRWAGCEQVLKMAEGDEKSLKDILAAETAVQGVVWWEPRMDGMTGRIYQIQVGDTVHLSYDKTARLYMEKRVIQDDPDGAHNSRWMATYLLMLPVIGLLFAFFWFLPNLQKRAKRSD